MIKLGYQILYWHWQREYLCSQIRHKKDRGMFVKEFETIYFEYYDMVFRYVFSLCKEETWAEEITQEAFLRP